MTRTHRLANAIVGVISFCGLAAAVGLIGIVLYRLASWFGGF